MPPPSRRALPVAEIGRLDIVGAGPAGLSAAISAQRAGAQACVHEKNAAVGGRFHGDFQGLENWTSERDVLDELAMLGIEPNFEAHPVREFVCFDPLGGEHVLKAAQPVFYLVRRGSEEGTVDRGLLGTAQKYGAEIRFGERARALPHGGVVAEGPHAAHVIAAGHVFETDMADGCYAAVAERLAPGGYAYVLINQGRGTVAACLFDDFHAERAYVSRTVEFFEQRIGLRWQQARAFGGSGNFAFPATAQRGGRLYAGEAAGFQDALFGFGLRFAVVSGAIAGRAGVKNPAAYDRLWQRQFGGQLHAGHATRRIFRWLGDRGHRWVLAHLLRNGDPRRLLHRIYAPKRWKRLLSSSPGLPAFGRATGPMDGCDCTWCRCAQGERSAAPGANQPTGNTE